MADIEPQREQLRAKLDLLDSHLARHLFVLGSQPSLADLSFFHPVNTLKMIPQTVERLDPYSHIKAWLERIEAFGYGKMSDMTGGEAVSVARVATPASGQGVDPHEPNDLRLGDRVSIVHESFGNDPVTGELVASSVHDISIRREDDMAGEVVVHFPREHYKVRKA